MFELKDLTSRQCHYPVTDAPLDAPALMSVPAAKHLFCGEPKADPENPRCNYCARHMALCYPKGTGKDWNALYSMMRTVEQSVAYMSVHRSGAVSTRMSRDSTPDVVAMIDGVEEDGNKSGVRFAAKKARGQLHHKRVL